MRIDFDEKNHIYRVDGDIASISVTELLHKHGLAPDYSGVSKTVLKAAAARGKEIHKDLENVCNLKNYTPTTSQGAQFDEWIKQNVDCAAAEQVLAYDFDGMIIAGTADILGFLKNGELFVGDHKTTSTFDREYVSWQVSLLDYMARKNNGRLINDRPIFWRGASKFYCFWYNGDTMTVKELTKIDDKEIEKLLMAELNGDLYVRPELVVADDLRAQVEIVERVLAKSEADYKQAKENAEKLRAELLAEMERQGIKSYETDAFKVTYVAPVDRLTVDSKKLKAEYPQAYANCQKLTKVKASVRVTIKGEENEE